MSNIATRARTRCNLSASGKAVMRACRQDPQGVAHAYFPSSPTWGLQEIDDTLEVLHLNRTLTVASAQRNVGGQPVKLQSFFLHACC